MVPFKRIYAGERQISIGGLGDIKPGDVVEIDEAKAKKLASVHGFDAVTEEMFDAWFPEFQTPEDKLELDVPLEENADDSNK